MRHMTFKGAHVYTCLSILLEDFNIHKTDVDIVLDMRMPYLFHRKQLSKTKVTYMAGTRLQEKKWFDLFLNHHNLAFNEENLTRLQSLTMLNNLSKFKRKALLSIYMDDQQYAVVFSHYDLLTNKYIFIMPEQLLGEHYRQMELDEETLLSYLRNRVNIGFINPSDEKQYLLVDMISQSIEILDDYATYVSSWCKKKHTKHRQLEAFNMVFRALLTDSRRMLELKGEHKLANQIKTLSHHYIHYLKSTDERFMIPLADEFEVVIKAYQTFIEDYYKRIRYTLTY